MPSPPHSIGTLTTLAIVWEVSAPKPGNVHRGADFEDVTYVDFIAGAVVIGPVVERVAELGIGRTVLDAVRATRQVAQSNTNLGTLLLIVPLAASPAGAPLASGIKSVLATLTFDDTCNIYDAIRSAVAGGLGKREDADVSEPPPTDLRLVDAMKMAADRDLVARQYGNGFADVVRIANWIEEGIRRGWSRDDAIVHAYVRQLAHEADSLIARKCGPEVAQQVQAMAGRVFDAGEPGDDAYHGGLDDFDFWLRSDGHRRNPGTTADRIAAAFFVFLREARVNSGG